MVEGVTNLTPVIIKADLLPYQVFLVFRKGT
jgi:hypothetical protein